jgi:hypothetical protein
VRKPSDYYAEFRDRLRSLGAEPVGIGALAAIRYRLAPRETTDIDFLVRSLDGVAESMQELGYAVKSMAQPGEPPYVVFVRGEDAHVDIILAETDYQLEAHARATDGWLTAEDVIVHKLIAWRPRDRDDIESILITRPQLDHGYIERWATEWEVAHRWQYAKDHWLA